MKRLRCIFLNGLAALSALMFVATVTLWVRSYFANDWVGRVHYTPRIDSEDHHVWLNANCGILELSGGGDPIENFSRVHWEVRHLRAEQRRGLSGTDGPTYLRWIGIAWQKPTRIITWEIYWTVSMRLGLLAILSGFAAGFIVTPWQSIFVRTNAGMCRHCGYDLRATRDRCPECGTIPAATIRIPD